MWRAEFRGLLTVSLDPTTVQEQRIEWPISAELGQTGTEMYLELFEVEPDLAPDPAPAATRLPEEGQFLVGYEAVGPVGRFVAVPIRHVVGDCDSTPVVLEKASRWSVATASGPTWSPWTPATSRPAGAGTSSIPA